ncbi:hypothetical protein PFUGPA_05694 [Plasmodium falciparum Palo Alto/Uganda]|uniref:Uncharacterized protein n=1 Tax=Plasmodium falciparum (isolate Palo Alto / Uganda) TaxID=57270 RepID=W4IRK5_PLAFP|nr:hypothetical protein PFUGPA_05694 [Plasmodium falciparum Palo Alto/Uganda]
MKSVLDKNKKKEDEQLLKAKELKEKIESMKNDLVQLKKEKENILSDKNLVLEAKKKELDKKVDGVELEIMNNSYMINDVLKKVREIFKKTHVQYEYEEDLKPLLIRLQHININSDEIK